MSDATDLDRSTLLYAFRRSVRRPCHLPLGSSIAPPACPTIDGSIPGSTPFLVRIEYERQDDTAQRCRHCDQHLLVCSVVSEAETLPRDGQRGDGAAAQDNGKALGEPVIQVSFVDPKLVAVVRVAVAEDLGDE